MNRGSAVLSGHPPGLGVENRGHLGDGDDQVLVEDGVVVFRDADQLVGRPGRSAPDHARRLGVPARQPVDQHLGRRRQHEQRAASSESWRGSAARPRSRRRAPRADRWRRSGRSRSGACRTGCRRRWPTRGTRRPRPAGGGTPRGRGSGSPRRPARLRAWAGSWPRPSSRDRPAPAADLRDAWSSRRPTAHESTSRNGFTRGSRAVPGTSRARPSSRSTCCAISASFALEPIVFTSRPSSCARKPSCLPTGSVAGQRLAHRRRRAPGSAPAPR